MTNVSPWADGGNDNIRQLSPLLQEVSGILTAGLVDWLRAKLGGQKMSCYEKDFKAFIFS